MARRLSTEKLRTRSCSHRNRWLSNELSLKLLQSLTFERSWPQHQHPQVPGGDPKGGVVGVKQSWQSCWEIRSWTDTMELETSISLLQSCAMDQVKPVPAGICVAWYQAVVSINSWSPSSQQISILSLDIGTFSQLAKGLGRSIHTFLPQIWLCIVITPGLSWSTCSGFPVMGLAPVLPKKDHTVPVLCQAAKGTVNNLWSNNFMDFKKLAANEFSNTKLLYQSSRHSCQHEAAHSLNLSWRKQHKDT